MPSSQQKHMRDKRSLNSANMQLMLIISLLSLSSTCISATTVGKPSPRIWPETFHALAVQNRNGSLALVDLYYEWKKGRNANLIHKQLGTTLYDIE